MVTVVADRESDMYPAWASVPQPGFHLLSRAMHALAKHAPAEAARACSHVMFALVLI